jgi:hypothetical protein
VNARAEPPYVVLEEGHAFPGVPWFEVAAPTNVSMGPIDREQGVGARQPSNKSSWAPPARMLRSSERARYPRV